LRVPLNNTRMTHVRKIANPEREVNIDVIDIIRIPESLTELKELPGL